MENTIICRYLDDDQFDDMLSTSSLFFTHRDQIPEYEEGKLPDNIEMQIRYWSSQNHDAILKQQFSQFNSSCIISSYNEENILAKELQQTQEFLDKSFFSCWHISQKFNTEVMKGLGKSIAIKTSTNKLLKSFEKKGIMVQSGRIYYYTDLNEINALRRRNLLFSIPKIWQNENEFRILLPLYKSTEIFLYETYPEYRNKRRDKEYKMYKSLSENIINDEYSHGVLVPFDLRIISEIYLPTNKLEKFKKKLESTNLIKKTMTYGDR